MRHIDSGTVGSETVVLYGDVEDAERDQSSPDKETIALYQADGYPSYVPPEFEVQSLEELERRAGQPPPGTQLHWNPIKRDPSGTPMLFAGQYDQFAKFCRDHKIALLITPRRPPTMRMIRTIGSKP